MLSALFLNTQARSPGASRRQSACAKMEALRAHPANMCGYGVDCDGGGGPLVFKEPCRDFAAKARSPGHSGRLLGSSLGASPLSDSSEDLSAEECAEKLSLGIPCPVGKPAGLADVARSAGGDVAAALSPACVCGYGFSEDEGAPVAGRDPPAQICSGHRAGGNWDGSAHSCC